MPPPEIQNTASQIVETAGTLGFKELIKSDLTLKYPPKVIEADQ
jgi:hypothetical protein